MAYWLKTPSLLNERKFTFQYVSLDIFKSQRNNGDYYLELLIIKTNTNETIQKNIMSEIFIMMMYTPK